MVNCRNIFILITTLEAVLYGNFLTSKSVSVMITKWDYWYMKG